MDEKEISLRDLYPGHTDEWYSEADDRIRRYIGCMIRIYERVLREQGPEAASKLARGK